MKLVTVLLIALMVGSIFLSYNFTNVLAQNGQTSPDVYVGVDIAFQGITETKQIIDRVSSYANLIVIGWTGITYNVTRLNDIAQYIYDRNMYFIIYTAYSSFVPISWFQAAKDQWGNHFLGLYVYDELGGRQLDLAENFTIVSNASSYGDAANQFTNQIMQSLNRFSQKSGSMPLFTSDYALYYYDYQAGYSTVFAELGWNYSRLLNVALDRGAATVLNKDWGAIISWKYTKAPYLESGPELYDDMVFAYTNGAKYIIVFDANEGWTQNILANEHFDAINQFWRYIKNNPRISSTANGRVAYVLPKDYGYGFRGPMNDKIWGLWEADSITLDLSVSVSILLQRYDTKLDIIYEDAVKFGDTYGYSDLIYWNDPAPVVDQWPPDLWFPHPLLTSSPTPSLTPLPTPTLTASPSPSPTPFLPPTPQPTPTTDPPATPVFPMYYAYAVAAGILVTVTALLVFKKRR